MISVCIPVYNFDITDFFSDLREQLEETGKKYEFIIIDDGSEYEFKKVNRDIKRSPNVNYFELEENLGRSKVRNLLVKEAKYEHLLIMDCDSKVVTSKYISNYLPYCQGSVVVCGGTVYSKKPPKDKRQMLRWVYGKKRESLPAIERKKNPNRSFMTNNFFISKSIFKQVKFDESLVKYGHEDTLFGYELNILGIEISHIDNPLMHIGIENNIDFIRKTKEGIDNLHVIIKKYPYEKLYDDIKLISFYQKINKKKLSWFFVSCYYMFGKLMLINLRSRYPNLKVFDFYKICYLCSSWKNKRNLSELS